MKTKTFDALAMTRAIRDKLAEQMEGMTPDECLQYMRKRLDASPMVQKFMPHRTPTAIEVPLPGASKPAE